jgi:hypothetical protein
MKTTVEQFHSFRGHVTDGCVIVAPSGREFTLTNTMRGWQVLGPNKLPISGYLPSAADVEYFVVNGLYSS